MQQTLVKGSVGKKTLPAEKKKKSGAMKVPNSDELFHNSEPQNPSINVFCNFKIVKCLVGYLWNKEKIEVVYKRKTVRMYVMVFNLMHFFYA